MEARTLFEPSLYAWASYCAGFCLRYFGLAGGLYWLLHVRFRHRSAAYRIQQTFPRAGDVRREIFWSMTNTASTGLSTMLIYALVRDGRTQMYFAVDDRGWVYFLLSAALAVLGYDTWNYWQHRLLHTPWWFRHVHGVHHRSGNPTAFSAFALHPVETLMGNAFFVLFVVVVPIHPAALALGGAYLFGYGTLLHLGYEFFPRWVARHPVLGLFNNATYHNLHHTGVGANFGGWFIWWDRLLGTGDPAYPAAFDAVAARRAAA